MLTLYDAKKHLRVETILEDALIDSLIASAYRFAEDYTNRVILRRTEILYLETFPQKITLPELPVVSLTSILYNDTDGVQQSFTDYYLNARALYATLQAQQDFTFPSTDESYENIIITYETGYATIPTPIDQAVLLIIGSLYEQRENHIIGVSINKVPLSAEYLLNAYRVVSL